MKSWLQDNDIEMYSTHNDENSVVAERCIGALKNKIYEYMTVISKSVNINNLNDIVNKYSNDYNITIKMKPVDVKSTRYIDFDKKNDEKNPKFNVSDHVKISKYKNISTKGYVPNRS